MTDVYNKKTLMRSLQSAANSFCSYDFSAYFLVNSCIDSGPWRAIPSFIKQDLIFRGKDSDDFNKVCGVLFDEISRGEYGGLRHLYNWQ